MEALQILLRDPCSNRTTAVFESDTHRIKPRIQKAATAPPDASMFTDSPVFTICDSTKSPQSMALSTELAADLRISVKPLEHQKVQ